MRFIVGWWLYGPSAVYTIYTSVMVIRIVIMEKMRKAVVGFFFYIPLLNPLWTGDASMSSSKTLLWNVTSHQIQHFSQMRLLIKYNILSNTTSHQIQHFANATSHQIQHFVKCNFSSITTFCQMRLLIKYNISSMQLLNISSNMILLHQTDVHIGRVLSVL